MEEAGQGAVEERPQESAGQGDKESCCCAHAFLHVSACMCINTIILSLYVEAERK